MRKLILIFLTLSLSFSFSASQAEIYKYTDENGNAVFTDKPTPNAKRIKKKDVQTLSVPKIPQQKKVAKPSKPFKYQTFEIHSPKNNKVMRNNDGKLNVDLTIQPELNTNLGHSVVLILDGTPVSKAGTSTSFSLQGLERGRHFLSAKILDSRGKTIRACKTSTVHIKQISTLISSPNRPGNAKSAPIAPQAPRAPQAL